MNLLFSPKMDRKDAPIYAYVARLEAREKAQKKKRALTGTLFLVILATIFIILSKFESEKQFTEASIEDLTPHQVRTMLENDKHGLIVSHNYGEDTVLDMEDYFRLLEELAQKEGRGKSGNSNDEWIYEKESSVNPTEETPPNDLNTLTNKESSSKQNNADNNANRRIAPERDIAFQNEGTSRSEGQQRGQSKEFSATNPSNSGVDTANENEEPDDSVGVINGTSVVALPAIPRLRAEKMPRFPGGEQAIKKYVHQNKKMPAEAVKNQIRGTVYVRFIVNEDGTIGYPKIVKGLGYGCDDEALRLVRHMPRWQAGEHGGRRVPVYETLAITF